MSPEELDRILESEDAIEPSQRFAANVMRRLRAEAEEPSSLKFPWWRFGLGVAASGAMAAGGSALLMNSHVVVAAPPAHVLAIVYAFAMLLIGLGVAALPRMAGKW